MSNANIPDSPSTPEPDESFADVLSQYEHSHSHKREDGGRQLEGIVVTVTAESVLLDIGFKTEGILPLTAFPRGVEGVKPGDKFPVTVKGRDPEGYYELTLFKVAQPTDWASLEKAFAEKSTIVGTVTAVIKGGVSVDIGVRAFMPASRSGTREAADLEKLVGEEIRCRIIKLDVQDEDVVVDRRIVAEEEERSIRERRYSEVAEGEIVTGIVRSLTDYGAFVDIGGVDGLLHVGDISWARIANPADVLTVGQEIEAKVLKVDSEKRRISLGMKQLQPDPWDSAAGKYQVNARVRGPITRVAEFGAFVELEPGLEGLIHVSEMSWTKKMKKANTIVSPGETVEAVVLGVDAAQRRISLGLKQALGDPWDDVARRFPVGSEIEGPVTSIMKFGAFVQLTDGVEGMVHISEISAEKRINHPQDVLKAGQVVKALVLAIDREKRQLRLSMKQLVPTGLDEYIVEHKQGDVVTGRVVDESGEQARVELGEGIHATCRIAAQTAAQHDTPSQSKADLSSLSAMLNARWKGGAPAGGSQPEAVRAGQIRSFRIIKLDSAAKTIELELA